MLVSSKKTTPLLLLLILISLVTPGNNRPMRVTTLNTLQAAAEKALPGDTIFLADGVYRGERTDLSSTGRSGHPVVIAAETPGKVTIESPLRLSGSHLTLSGLKFAGEGSVEVRGGTGIRITRCTWNNVQSGKWIVVDSKSREAEIDHCRFEQKENNRVLDRGCQLLQVRVTNSKERHHIHHNHFLDIPQGKGNGFETLQLITESNPFNPPGGNSETVIEYNLFERCNGESEIISVKSNGNFIRSNTFRACRGSLVLRHGHRNRAERNFFTGDGERGSGGIRIQGTDQVIANNYFQDLGTFGVAMMNGTPDQLYVRVERAEVLFNTFINCRYAMEIGLNHSSHPNGAVPADCRIAGNLFYNPMPANPENSHQLFRFVNDIQPQNWVWIDNLTSGHPGIHLNLGLLNENPLLQKAANGLWYPTEKTPGTTRFSAETGILKMDIFGNPRTGSWTNGAMQFPADPQKSAPLTASHAGPDAR